MTIRFLKVMWLLGSLMAFTLVVNAQTEVLTVHVPFAFEAGGKLLPAGDYRVNKEEGSNILLMQNGTGSSTMFLTMTADTFASAETASLVFERQGATLVLSSIRLPGRQTRVLPSHFAVRAGVLSSVSTGSVSSR